MSSCPLGSSGGNANLNYQNAIAWSSDELFLYLTSYNVIGGVRYPPALDLSKDTFALDAVKRLKELRLSVTLLLTEDRNIPENQVFRHLGFSILAAYAMLRAKNTLLRYLEPSMKRAAEDELPNAATRILGVDLRRRKWEEPVDSK